MKTEIVKMLFSQLNETLAASINSSLLPPNSDRMMVYNSSSKLTANLGSDTDKILDYPRTHFRNLSDHVFLIIYAAIFFVGFVGNFLVIYFVLFYKRMQTMTNKLITNLSIAVSYIIVICFI